MTNSIYNTIAADISLSTLTTLIQDTDFISILQSPGPFTVFAPSNMAFEALRIGVSATLLESITKEKLAEILTYHILPGHMTSDVLQGTTMRPKTYEGDRLPIEDGDNGLQVGAANIVTGDIECENGIIHIIDHVLLPT